MSEKTFQEPPIRDGIGKAKLNFRPSSDGAEEAKTAPGPK